MDGIGLLPRAATVEYVAALAALWRDGAATAERMRIVSMARRLHLSALTGGARLRAALRAVGKQTTYLVVSHQNLDRPRPIARLKATAHARFVCLIHDLIPLDAPHLTRPRQTARHRKRIAAVAALADAAIANSSATADALRCWLGHRQIPIGVAPLGTDLPDGIPPPPPGAPYFVCLGTIETRKNHDLLLDVWQRLMAQRGDGAPRLLLIGKRGFGSERFVSRLAALGDIVVERGELPDRAVTALLRGARALLLPSLAEGFGLPVAEALTLGVPVLCSDLPALRETGSEVPEYLDPQDGASWLHAVLDFTTDSSRHRAQLARLARWRPPSWSDHFAIAEQTIATL